MKLILEQVHLHVKAYVCL